MIYSVTCLVSNDIREGWLEWMREHIPQVLGTGLFSEARISRVMSQDTDDGGTSYNIQYRANSRDALYQYYQEHADKLRQQGIDKWGEKVIAFRTELEMIDEYRVNYNQPINPN